MKKASKLKSFGERKFVCSFHIFFASIPAATCPRLVFSCEKYGIASSKIDLFWDREIAKDWFIVGPNKRFEHAELTRDSVKTQNHLFSLLFLLSLIGKSL